MFLFVKLNFSASFHKYTHLFLLQFLYMDSNFVPQKDWQTGTYEFVARKSPILLKLFPLVYAGFAVAMIVGAYINLTHSFLFDVFYKLGKLCGEAALGLLGVVILPGIMGRLKIEIKISRLITLFRRQLGITVFLLALAHYMLLRLLPIAAGIFPFSLPVGFEVFGSLALFMLFALFLTSNNYSMRKLGPWWKRLHRFVYIAVGVLVLHTVFQRIGPFSIFIGTLFVLEIVSWCVYWVRQNSLEKPVAD